MDNATFLSEFTQHLTVGEPRRSEILAEIDHHLKEKNNLGDPKLLAEKMNRTHLGIFWSFRRLVVFRLLVWLGVDVLLTLGLSFFEHWLVESNHWEGFWRFFLTPIFIFLAFLPLVLLTVGVYTISRMYYRWRYLAGWVLLMAVLSLAALVFWGILGTMLFDSVTGVPWYISQFQSDILLFGMSGIVMLLLMTGRHALMPRHQVIDVAAAFVIQSFGASFLVTLFTNSLSSAYSSTAWTMVENWVAVHRFILSVGIGLIGAGLEWWRVRQPQVSIQAHE